LPGTPCDTIPWQLIIPIGAKVANLYVAPNSTNPGFNYINQPVRKLNEGTWDIRLDHNFSSKDSAFARFSYDQATTSSPAVRPRGLKPTPLQQTSTSTIMAAMRY